MSTTQILHRFPTSLTFDSDEDEDPTIGSDIEGMLTAVDWSAKEYWLGKKYVKFALAEQLLKNSHPDESLPELDVRSRYSSLDAGADETKSRLQAALRDHPFEENLNLIQDQVPETLLRDSCDSYEGLLTTVGSILREGSKADIRLLVLSLRKHRSEKASLGTSPMAANRKAVEVAASGSQDIASPADLGCYAQALKEYGERVGAQPHFRIESQGLNSPAFEASLIFQGLNIKARGKSKKEARHRAAKQGCQNLRLPVK